MGSYENITNTTNNMYGCNGEINQPHTQRLESIIMAIAMLVIVVISAFGNSLIIFAVCTFENLRELTYALLCSLAISDLLAPIARMLFIAISNFNGRWIFGCKWCSISLTVGVFFLRIINRSSLFCHDRTFSIHTQSSATRSMVNKAEIYFCDIFYMVTFVDNGIASISFTNNQCNI